VIILANPCVRISFVAVVLAACGTPVASPFPAAVAPLPASGEAVVVVADASIGISENQARLELDRMFREAGFRILNDELLVSLAIEVTLDGYDPEERVGYEYIDSSEATLSMGSQERAALGSDGHILILEACSLPELRQRAAAFLAGHATRP